MIFPRLLQRGQIYGKTANFLFSLAIFEAFPLGLPSSELSDIFRLPALATLALPSNWKLFQQEIHRCDRLLDFR